jgi:hypothetical protein
MRAKLRRHRRPRPTHSRLTHGQPRRGAAPGFTVDGERRAEPARALAHALETRAAANALSWRTQAAEFGVDTPAEQLDRTTVLVNLCIHVTFTRSEYPDPAIANQAGTLEVRAGMQFGSQPNLALELFTWKTVITGSTNDGTQNGETKTSASDGDVFVTGSSCSAGQRIAVELPALTSANTFAVGAGSTVQPCSITVDAPKLTSVLLSANFTAGVTSVNLGGELTAQAITFSATGLRSIGLPVVHLQRLVISGNPQLTSVGGSGGVTTQIVITSNENLSTVTATLFANNFDPHGTIIIDGNKIP